MKKLIAFDIEVYPNYFLIVLKNIHSNKILSFSAFGKNSKLIDIDIKNLKRVFNTMTTFGFNNLHYDNPILLYALSGKTCTEIFNMSVDIITGKNNPGWKTLKKYNLSIPRTWDNFDIMGVAPGTAGLKLYGARLHTKKLQDLPYEFDTSLNEEQANNVKLYCINDIALTHELYSVLEAQINLRVDISKQYGIDMRSRSDAQIAEAIIKSKLNIRKADIKPTNKFKWRAPSMLRFKCKALRDIQARLEALIFSVDAKGSIIVPNELKTSSYTTKFGHKLQMGIGGLHSCEKSKTYKDNLIDADVASYYPSIILECELYPKNLGMKFLTVYRNLVNKRLTAKHNNNSIVNSTLKIVINGSFGKLGSKFSVLYAPDLLLQVTITGQLLLLMLIEQLEEVDIEVISANTDGIVSIVPPEKQNTYDNICWSWQIETGFELEFVKYKALYSRDVNNYLAITTENKLKTKGIFKHDDLAKNPQATIIYKAVTEYLQNNIPIEKTIKSCLIVSEFLFVRKVNGGAVWQNNYIGKVVRWIYSTKGSTINYKTNGNKVPKSDNSLPIINLDKLPSSIDYNRYINEANSILELVGITTLNKE